jgi:hypothetical protein
MAMGTTVPTATRPPLSLALVGAIAAGGLVAVLLGVYGRVHDPTGQTVVTAVFSGQIQFKAWMTTLAVLFAIAQLVSAMRIYGRIGPRAPAWLGDFHRLTGTLAFLCSLPVAFHCLWALGFRAEPGLNRVFLHSLGGLLFYGAFTTKVIVVRSRNLPGMALPIVGGTVFTALVLVWFTSSYWFFTSFPGAKL